MKAIKRRGLSIRSKLMFLFSVTILFPLLIIVYAMPAYYIRLNMIETEKLTGANLVALANNIKYYLDELDRVTIIPYNYDEVLRALKLRSGGLYESADAYTKYKADYALYSTLPAVIENLRKEISGTLLLPFDGSIFYKDSRKHMNIARSDYNYRGQDWYRRAIEANGKAIFIKTQPQDYLTVDSESKVFSVARLIKDPDSSNPIAVIKADADTIVLDRIVRQTIVNDSVIVITDKEGQLVYASSPISRSVLEQMAEHSTTIQFNAKSYVAVSNVIGSSSWEITSLISESHQASKVRWMYITGLIFAFIGFVLTLFLFLAYSRKLLVPFREMIEVMHHVQRGDMSKRVSIYGKDEIAKLGRALNKMIGKLDEMIISDYRSKLNQQKAELRALQSQIKPHFLYNTLNGFSGLNRKGERALLEKAILSLSGLLRYILSSDMTITLTDEFNIIKKYADLQSMRFSDRLEFHCSLDPRLEKFQIPKLLLQPLVENSVVHGTEPSVHPCLVEVDAKLKEKNGGQCAVITISDNGVGFSVDSNNLGDHIGLQNVKDRLMLSYPGRSRFLIHSEAGQGTRITIIIDLYEEELMA
ncbi:sensor histidine kinase [Paenibacillus sp. BR2-3]|uniref:cache domain-containing sensor histidine kinase n=1 Tax=Paenibacillus sp. BR2-3 TaxID=3048494 RepID=UPI003977393A